jgi:hypothetical protein
MNFADRISRCIQEFGPLVVGLDPHIEYLPPVYPRARIQRKRKNLGSLGSCSHSN